MYRPGGGPIDEGTLPPLGAGFRLIAEVDVAGRGPAEGIVCALGDWNNGWACYLVGGRLVVTFALFSQAHRIAAAPDLTLGPGTHLLTVEYRRHQSTVGGVVTLAVDGQGAGEGRLPADLPFRWQVGSAGLLIGRDRGFPVSDDYQTPFPFRGIVHQVIFEIPRLAPPETAEVITTALRRE